MSLTAEYLEWKQATLARQTGGQEALQTTGGRTSSGAAQPQPDQNVFNIELAPGHRSATQLDI